MLNFLNRKGQNTAEYALLIALVVAGIIAIQTYAQRALQARVRDASQFMVKGGSATGVAANITSIGTTDQYEPYYLNSSYDVTRDSQETTVLGQNIAGKSASTNRERGEGGYQKSTYGAAEKIGH